MSNLNISDIDIKYINFNIKEFKSQGYTYYRIQKQLDKNNKINVTGKTKEEAKEKYFNKLEDFLNTNLLSLDVKNLSFSKFVSYYLFDILLPSGSVKAKTLTTYNTFYKNHIKDSLIGDIKLIDLKKEHFQKYFNNLLNTNLKINTIKQIKVFISTILNYAINEDYIIKNHCNSIKLPKSNNIQKKKCLSDEEIKLVFEKCKDKMLLIIIKIALSTGMRINEILALKETDFNFEECSININKTLSYSKIFKDELNYENKTITTLPKSSSSIRKVYFNPTISQDIKNYICNQKQYYLKFGKKYSKNDFIFTNRNFNIISICSLSRKLKSLFIDCGIDASGFHIFRHTSGSNLYELGVNIKTISEQLDHSNTSITSNIYVHLNEENKRDAIKHLDKYFNTV